MTESARALGEPALERVDVEPGHHAFGVVANMAIQIWWARANAPHVRFLLATGDELASRYPRGFGTIHLCMGGAGLPDKAARELFEEALAQHGDLVGDVGVVFEGTGFWVGALRGFMTGLKMAVGSKAQFRVFPSVMELLSTMPEYHYERTGVQVGRKQLDAAIRHLAELAGRPI